MNAFIQFLIISLAYVLLVVCIGNYVAGVLSGSKEKGFDFKLALTGIWELIELAIVYILVAWFIYSIRDIQFVEISMFTVAFKILTILIIAYKGNSLLLNLVTFSKIPMPIQMVNFDKRVKALFESDTPISGMNIKFNADEIVFGDTGMTDPYSKSEGTD